MAKKDDKFPRNLYKKGGEIKWMFDHTYSTILVENEDEMKSALKTGYIDNLDEALFGESVEEEIEIELDEDF